MNVATPKPDQTAVESAGQATIVVRKVKKKGHGGHHGGAWKVAYADFVTAMMAFFLLLWLLNATTEEQKRAISNYFAPEAPAYTKSGSGGVLGGRVIADDGGATAARGGGGIVVPIPRAPRAKKPDHDNSDEQPGHPPGGTAPHAEMDAPARKMPPAEKAPPAETAPPAEAGDTSAHTDTAPQLPAKVDEARARDIARKMEQKRFAEAEAAIRGVLNRDPDLRKLADNLLIDRTPEGLRIQMVDQDKLAMFPRGSAKMLPHTRELLRSMAAILRRLPNKIAITGHTDATPYANPDGYSNWDLSADRANASRRALMDAGIPANRFARVVGKADQDPLLPDDPTNPRNRRVTILLLTQQKPPGKDD